MRSVESESHEIVGETQPSPAGIDWRLRVCQALAAVLIVWTWILPIANSFWLDETLVAVLIKGTLAQALSNTALWPHSVLFSGVEWIASHVTQSSSEIALRLPSLFAALMTLYVWYRIGCEFFDRECGIAFAILYVLLPQVAPQVSSARPYALALLMETTALLFLLRWLKAHKASNVYLWALCSAIAFHLQIMFALAFGIEILFVLALSLYRRSMNVWVFLRAAAVGIAVMAAMAPQLLMEFRERGLLEFPLPAPGFRRLSQALVPAAFIPILVLGVLWGLGRASNRRKIWNAPFLLGLALTVIPVSGFFALSHLGMPFVFVPRYLLPAAPGLIIVWGLILWSIQRRWIRELSLACSLTLAAVIAVPSGLISHYYYEDWRAAAGAVQNARQLIVYPGLVETRQLDWLDEPRRWPFLIAPALAYRPHLSQEDGLVLPFSFGAAERANVKRRLGSRLEGQKSVAVIAREMFSSEQWISWISEQARADGFRKIVTSRFGMVDVVIFNRNK